MKKLTLAYFIVVGLTILPRPAEAQCPWWWPNCPWGTTTTTTAVTTTSSVSTTTSSVSTTTSSVSTTTSSVSTTTTSVSTTTTSAGSTTTTSPATTTIGSFDVGDFQCSPLFTSVETPPNVLIVFDNSGSMNYMAQGYDASGYYHPDSFDPATRYYGYFDPYTNYTFNGTKFDRDPAGNWDGNFLNWLSMRRVDVARKVLVGGQASSRTGGGLTDLIGEDPAQEHRKFFKFYWDSGTYTPYSSDHVYKISKGNIEVYSIDMPASFNYGLDYTMHCNAYNGHDSMFEDIVFWYNGNSDDDEQGYSVYPRIPTETGACDYDVYDTGGSSLTSLTFVESFPIRVEKDEAEEPNSFLEGNIAGVVQAVGDKVRFGLEFYNDDDEGGHIANYIGDDIADLVSSIEDKGCDTWTPLAETLYEGIRYFRQDAPYYDSGDYTVSQNNDPFYFQDEGEYVECAKSFILLISDGESTQDLNIPAFYQDYDNDGNDPGSYDSNGTDYLDDVALWAHTNDNRTGSKDLPGDQIINLFTVFAFGSGSSLLRDAAKNGGFEDINGNGQPDLDIEWDKDGDTVPDTYLEAPDGNELELKIARALTDILRKSASGTAVSILSTSAEGEGSLYQAHFMPMLFDNLRKVDWVGYLNALWVDTLGNIREDTVNDDALIYGDDKIIRFTTDPATGDTAIARYHDNTGPDGYPDGIADSDTPYETVLVTDLKPQWEAGKQLALRAASTRTIKTWVDRDGDNVVDTATEYIDFTVANAAILRPFLGVATVTEAEDIIEFIRGEEVPGYRDRNVTIEGTQHVWKLGDIVYSTPTLVGEPMEKYNIYYSDVTYAEFFKKWEERGVTVYVGANDGMLHAFKAGTFHEGDDPSTAEEEHGWYSADEDPPTSEALGDERWAYIPYNLLPHLKWLIDPDYPHVYYVDLKAKVTDVRIFSDDTTHPNGWGTILVGGMRLGGEEISLEDDFNGDGNDEIRTFRSAYAVLDITDPTSPELLGEFNDPTMGLTTSYPAIARVEATYGFDSPENDEWFVVVGSGPTDCDGSSNQDGRFFIYSLDLQNGVLDMANRGLLHTIQTPENNALMATPVTIDLNLNYNVDTIYIGETYDDGVDERGKMFRISTRNDNNPSPAASPWPYKLDPSSNPWLMTTFFSPPTPVTASPTASIDEDDNIWIYFGTGKYYDGDDKNDTTTQYFYGIKDDCTYGVCGVSDEVDLADLYHSTDIIVLTNGQVVNATETNWDAFIDEVQAEKGWYIDMAAGGERLLTRPSILGGVVLFAPYTPLGGLCESGGTGSLYALYYETGTGFPEAILDTETYGSEEKSVTRVELGEGLTSEIGLHVGQKPTSTGFIQQGTGAVRQVDIAPALGIRSGIVGWQQY